MLAAVEFLSDPNSTVFCVSYWEDNVDSADATFAADWGGRQSMAVARAFESASALRLILKKLAEVHIDLYAHSLFLLIFMKRF